MIVNDFKVGERVLHECEIFEVKALYPDGILICNSFGQEYFVGCYVLDTFIKKVDTNVLIFPTKGLQ